MSKKVNAKKNYDFYAYYLIFFFLYFIFFFFLTFSSLIDKLYIYIIFTGSQQTGEHFMKKSQPSISRFFQAKGNKDKLKNEKFLTEPTETSLATKAKLSGFNHNEKLETDPLPAVNCEPKSLVVEELPPVKDSNSELKHDKDEEIEEIEHQPPHKKPKVLTKSRTKASKSNTTKKLTPLESQFLELKLNNHDKLLAVQVGYKFKFFGEDAEIASKILNIMLIPGNIKFEDLKNGNFAYCSIPDNRLHIHLQRLLNYGHKVGVVKQTETAAIKSVEGSKSGLFERKITGLYTKATYMGDEINTGDPTLQSKNMFEDNNLGDYIMCIDELNLNNTKSISIIAVQPLTGEIIYDTFQDSITRDNLETRIAYLLPSEIMVINNEEEISKETSKCIKIINNGSNLTIIHKKSKSEDKITDELKEIFSKISKPDEDQSKVIQFYQINYPIAIQSCMNELMQYLDQFKLANIFTIISNFQNFMTSGKYMLLPSQTMQALEIFQNTTDPTSETGTLAWLLNHTRTKMGHRLLKKWISKPLINIEHINERLDAIDDITSSFNHLIDALQTQLNKLKKSNIDLEKLLIKIHYSSTYNLERITRKELYLMLKVFSDMLKIINNFGEGAFLKFNTTIKSKLLKTIFNELFEFSKSDHLDNFLSMINPSGALNDSNTNDQKIEFFNLTDNYLCDAIVHELNEISSINKELDVELKNLQTFLKRPNLAFVTNLKETHLIEVRNGKQVDALPKDWIKISGTKTVSRFRTPSITKLHKNLQYHNEKLLKNCDESYNKFLILIDENYEFFHSITKNLSIFDCLLSFTASSLIKSNYIRPSFIPDKQIIKMKKSRNPIIENLPHGYTSFVSNDIDILYDENRVSLITGPNMGGKSSYVKQIALLVIMSQIGCFIPCDEAKLGIFDSIYIRMGASDNILKGKSTFMIEMLESVNIINNFSSRSLIILDEIGRGTGTIDGISIAYSILKYLIEHEKKPITLFITHYPSLNTLENDYPGQVTNYHMSFLEKKGENEWPEIIFLYNLVKGVISNSYGLNVANLAGIPVNIINRAFEISELMKHEIEDKRIFYFQKQFTKLIKDLHDEEIDEGVFVDKLNELSELN